jgi:hypothetical protein
VTFIKSEVEWLKKHGRRDDKGSWWCKETGKPINTAIVGRSIHLAIMPGAGYGEVRQVVHLACSGCEPDKVPPELGTPIIDAELTETI